MNDWKDKLSRLHNGGAGVKKKCIECGKEFEPKEAYHKLCIDCNRKNRESGGNAVSIKMKISDDYLKDGYFDEKGYLREGIFKDEAKEIAQILASLRMTPTSLRVFYNKVKAIENRYQASNNNFDLIKSSLYAFERDVAYQVSRRVVPEEFRKFIVRNTEIAIKGPKEFKGFVEHFLSVLAYFKDASK